MMHEVMYIHAPYRFLTSCVLREILHSAHYPLIFGRLLRDTNRSGAL